MRFRSYQELNYLAGALDERMHCYILKSGNIQVSFRTSGKLPIFLKRRFGGSYFLNGKPERFWYRAQGKNAAILLEAVLPYLKIKQKKARSILESWNEHQSRLK